MASTSTRSIQPGLTSLAPALSRMLPPCSGNSTPETRIPARARVGHFANVLGLMPNSFN